MISMSVSFEISKNETQYNISVCQNKWLANKKILITLQRFCSQKIPANFTQPFRKARLGGRTPGAWGTPGR